MNETADVVVVGAGIMGRAIAWQLAAAGRDVVVLDQHPDGARLGSSHGATRGLRYSYEDPAYARLAMHAERWWRVAERESGRELLRMIGGIDLGFPDAQSWQRTRVTVESLGLDHEILDARALRSRFPAFSPLPGLVALHQPGAGLIAADRAVAVFRGLAERHGARFRFGVRVTAFEERGAGVGVLLAGSGGGGVDDSRRAPGGGTIRCERLVIAAGPWTTALVPRLPLSVLACEPLFFGSTVPIDLPVLVFVHPHAGAADGVYIQPQADEAGVPARRLKVGRHGGRSIAAPFESVPGEIEAADELRARLGVLAEARRHEALFLVGRERCFYTMTPDEGFIVDFVDPARRVLVAAGFSGHGFKFAPVIGRAVCELITDGATDFETAGMRSSRFSIGPDGNIGR